MASAKAGLRIVAVALAAAFAWGSLTAISGFEFGAAAWLAGGVIGWTVGRRAPDVPRIGAHAIALAIATMFLAKLWFVLCPWGATKPTVVGAFRPIDLLWLAMACSAAQWMTVVASTRGLRSARTASKTYEATAPLAPRKSRPVRAAAAKPVFGPRWSAGHQTRVGNKGKQAS